MRRFVVAALLALASVEATSLPGVMDLVCADDCEDDQPSGECAPDCTDCVCCVRPRLTAPPELTLLPPTEARDFGAWTPDRIPASAEPQEILHVPKLLLA